MKKLAQFWRKKRGIMHHYNKIAKMYDLLYQDEQNLKIEHIVRHVYIRSSDLILDAGCGTGLFSRIVHNLAEQIVGVDLSKELLKVALSHLKLFGIKEASIICADVDFLPFKEKIFDKIFVLTLLQNSLKIEVTLREILRTAKDESTIILTGLKKVFSETEFKEAIIKEGLTPKILPIQEKIKDIIAICIKK